MIKAFRRPQKPRRKIAGLPGIALPEPPRPVAKLVVPFVERVRKCPQLIAAGADIPRFGNQLDACQNRVLPDRIQKAAIWVKAVTLAPQNGGQIEPEAVDMEGLDPIAQAVHHHAQHHRMGQIQRVSCAGIIHVISPAPGQPIVAGVVEAPERQCRAKLIAFRRVVVDHVQNHLDPGRMKAADHRLQLPDRTLGHIARLGGEKAKRVVTPMVLQALQDQKPVVDEGLNRQQFDRRDAKLLQMLQHRIAGHAKERAALALFDTGMQRGHRLYMRFIDQTVRA